MAEDTLVQMLLEVGGGAVADERDIELARATARWAVRNGWQLHLHNGFFFEVETLSFWILANRVEQVLEIRTRLEPGQGWLVHARHRIAHVGHGLNVLAAEDLIPPHLAPLGVCALDRFAEALDRGAGVLAQLGDEVSPADVAEYGEHYAWEMRIRAAVMNRAADQARAFPRSELAVSG